MAEAAKVGNVSQPSPPRAELAAPVSAGAKLSRPLDFNSRDLTTVDELPDTCWEVVENEPPGCQYLTKCYFGSHQATLMLDTGSAVNSIPENTLLAALNACRKEKIPMGDKRHPVHKLERWTKTEYVRGVAAGQRVALLGAVVMNVMMPRLGEKTGPIIPIKFKMT